MAKLTMTVPELVRLWEHDKNVFIETLCESPYNNQAILREVIKSCMCEISQKNQQIQYAKRDLKEAYDKIGKITAISKSLTKSLGEHE